MLKITELLDIEKIKDLRKECLNKELDEFDNFSYHIALIDEDKLFGTARFYKKEDTLMLDNVALKKDLDNCYYEILFRALLLKAINIDCKYIKVKQEREKDFYLKFGFNEKLTAKPDNIVFPKECGKNCNPTK